MYYISIFRACSITRWMKGVVFTHILGTLWGWLEMEQRGSSLCRKAAHALCSTVTVIRLVCVCSDRVPEQVDPEADLYVWKLLGSKQKSTCRYT